MNALGNVFYVREQKRHYTRERTGERFLLKRTENRLYKGTHKLTYFAEESRKDSTRESTRGRILLKATEIYYTSERITEGIKGEGIVQRNVEGHVF